MLTRLINVLFLLLSEPWRFIILIEIRRSRPEDASGLKRVQRITWLATYPNPNNGITLEDIKQRVSTYETPEAIADLRDRLEHLPPTKLSLLAADGNQIVGNSFFEKRENVNKIGALYVLPEYQGQGIGLRLASEGLKWLGGGKDVTLEVVKYNDRAIKFYRKLGFEIIGDAKELVDPLPSGARLPEYEMVKVA